MKEANAMTGVEIGRFFDPETDCWFVIYKFTSEEMDKCIQEELGDEEADDEEVLFLQ